MGVYADLPLPETWKPVLDGLRPVRYRWVGRKLPSLGALVDASLDLLPAERRLMVWERLGPEKTLQEIGDAHGLTRERIRQVVNKVTKAFLRDTGLRLVLDGVFSGLSSSGPIVVNVRDARSAIFPNATPEELWNFVMQVWCEIQRRPAQSVQLDSGIFLFAPDGLPTEKDVSGVMLERASFLYPAQLSAALGIHSSEVEAVACAFPKLVRTQGGLYGFRGWSQPQLIKAVAEQLARADFTDWHFSEIGKAVMVFDSTLEGQSARNFAAVISRKDALEWFEQAGRNGFWRLKVLGDGHQDNFAAIHAILEAASTPLHWTDIRDQIQRVINDGTITAMLGRDSRFLSLGQGVYGLSGRHYPSTELEDNFMQEVFGELKTCSAPARVVFQMAEQRNIAPKQLVNIGRYSEKFRYWKWREQEALFLTIEEAQRRGFQRWFYNRQIRSVPSQDVLTSGLKSAFERKDRNTLLLTYEVLQLQEYPLPHEAMPWIEWALGTSIADSKS